MALRTDLPKIPATDEPTFWNASAAKGWYAGILFTAGMLLTGLLIIQSAPLLGALIGIGSLLAPPITAVIWGFDRKAEMREELTHGKTVRDPTFWNKNIFSGLFLGALAGWAVELTAYALNVPLEFGRYITMGLSGVGGVIGGITGEKKMQAEFAQAEALQAGRWRATEPGWSVAPQQTRERGRAPSPYIDSVTQPEMKQLEERLNPRQGEPQHAQTVLASREMQGPAQAAK